MMWTAIALVAAAMLGAMVGVFVTCLCVAAGRADDRVRRRG